MPRHPYLEEVSGTIIGDITLSATVFYDGRQQGQKLSAADKDDAMLQAKAYKQGLRNEYGAEGFARIYPDDSLWELRIYD